MIKLKIVFQSKHRGLVNTKMIFVLEKSTACNQWCSRVQECGISQTILEYVVCITPCITNSFSSTLQAAETECDMEYCR